MKKTLVLSAVVLFAIGCSLCGCSNKSENAISEKAAASYPLPEPPVVVNCQPGIPGGKFIVGEVGDPKTFNFITANESSSIDLCRFIFWGLLNFDVPTQSVKPGLAESWTNSPDGKTWTFKLRKNLRWSDGAPLTADDVAFTWNDVIYNPNIDNVMRDPFIIGGKKFTIIEVDAQTIKVVTPEIYAPFLTAFGAGVPIMPKHILEKYVANGTFPSAYGVNWKPQDIVGSGPFRLKEYKPAQYTLLERNPYFLEVDSKGQRLPYFDDIVFTVVPDMNAMSLRFLSGESDVDDLIYPYEYDQFKTASASGKFQLLEPGAGLEMSFFWFNENTNVDARTGKPYVNPVKLKWFRNVKFRQACSSAIDRESIIKSILSGRGIPAYGFETPGNKKWFNPNVQKYPYDPARALELLKEIGIEKRKGDDFLTDTDGNRIEFVLNTNTGNNAREKAAVLIQSDLQKLGMKVIFQPIEFNTLISKIDVSYDYDCILMGLAPGTSADPFDGMNVIKSSGFTHFWFPRQKTPSTDWEARLDHLMDAQMKTLDYDERKKDYDEVQEIFAEQQPFIFTVTPMYYAAIRSDLGNVRPTSLTSYRATWNAEELYFKH
ncbi:MAG TPA: ABC transporter substrate-binding protein [Candidatus Limnocylindrales bacterium]|nr:ABC transporter substrate-binding protein [Candidatus Limnocylindrales bacterium]